MDLGDPSASLGILSPRSSACLCVRCILGRTLFTWCQDPLEGCEAYIVVSETPAEVLDLSAGSTESFRIQFPGVPVVMHPSLKHGLLPGTRGIVHQVPETQAQRDQAQN